MARAGGREVQPEARVLLKPGLHLGRLVGGVGVEDEMDVARLADGAVDAAQERQMSERLIRRSCHGRAAL